ncbi:CPBP family intramembrane glutamic endopeptidase [Microcella pacifica]|uniref:CPBP family intramembrane metalloprotease n=1 Tax=Microcella pacifica TaxID=2591847 RepID=A0A9E5JM21_9MICO|nr:CPBP family intramembrane glutamic endopeptidase [Microcella pacifica]NHF62109.1 CPBP family intramembrane metalloprotease [Microcella pacifica]
MLPDLDWLPRLAAALLATGLLVLFLVRAVRKDRREYARFRRYRSTARRQAMLRRWLIESLALFGGTAALVLVPVQPFVAPLLAETQALPPVAWLRDALTGGLGAGLLIGAVVGGTLLTVIGVRSARAEGGVVMVGDIASLLPRNRPELGWGAALSVNAGIVEEALFRLALPALLVIVTGEPISAFVLAALVFGALHAYQGWLGVVATSVVGLLFTTLYVVSGSILLAMLVHILFDLRTLVVIPMAVYRVHEVPGSVRFPRPLALATPPAQPEAAQPEADA